jgi:hypothetical protein
MRQLETFVVTKALADAVELWTWGGSRGWSEMRKAKESMMMEDWRRVRLS